VIPTINTSVTFWTRLAVESIPFSSIEMQSRQRYGKTSSQPRCPMRFTWYRIIYDLTPTHVRINSVNIRNTRDVCSVMTCTATTELWQWTRQRIASVLLTDHRLCAPQWLVLPDVTIWPKTRRNWSSVILRDYTAFLRPARMQADEIQKKVHIFGHH
jgi:hypothetical protein